jgi:hypothetical protein
LIPYATNGSDHHIGFCKFGSEPFHPRKSHLTDRTVCAEIV